MNVEAAARAEALAERTKDRASADWRAAWWRTTLALGALPKAGSGAAVQQVADILGQSVSQVTKRRVAGVRVIALGCKNVDTLPPRMTMAIPADRFTADTVERARQAEAEGVSLRDFAAEITGTAWADTPEGTSADRLAATLAAADPETIEAAADRLSSDDRTKVQRSTGRAAVKASEAEAVANGGRVPRPDELGPRPVPVLDSVATLLRDWGQVERKMATALDALRDYGAVLGEHAEQARGWALTILDTLDTQTRVSDPA